LCAFSRSFPYREHNYREHRNQCQVTRERETGVGGGEGGRERERERGLIYIIPDMGLRHICHVSCHSVLALAFVGRVRAVCVYTQTYYIYTHIHT
jgi:hypothetical protein